MLKTTRENRFTSVTFTAPRMKKAVIRFGWMVMKMGASRPWKDVLEKNARSGVRVGWNRDEAAVMCSD